MKNHKGLNTLTHRQEADRNSADQEVWALLGKIHNKCRKFTSRLSGKLKRSIKSKCHTDYFRGQNNRLGFVSHKLN